MSTKVSNSTELDQEETSPLVIVKHLPAYVYNWPERNTMTNRGWTYRVFQVHRHGDDKINFSAYSIHPSAEQQAVVSIDYDSYKSGRLSITIALIVNQHIRRTYHVNPEKKGTGPPPRLDDLYKPYRRTAHVYLNMQHPDTAWRFLNFRVRNDVGYNRTNTYGDQKPDKKDQLPPPSQDSYCVNRQDNTDQKEDRFPATQQRTAEEREQVRFKLDPSPYLTAAQPEESRTLVETAIANLRKARDDRNKLIVKQLEKHYDELRHETRMVMNLIRQINALKEGTLEKEYAQLAKN